MHENNAEELLIEIKTNVDKKIENVANFEKIAKEEEAEVKKTLKKTSSATNLKKAIEKGKLWLLLDGENLSFLAEEFKNSEKKEVKETA